MEINLQKMEDSNKQSENNTKKDPKRQLNYLIEKHKKELEEIPKNCLSVSPQSEFSEALSNEVEVGSDCNEREFDLPEEDNKDEFVLETDEEIKVSK